MLSFETFALIEIADLEVIVFRFIVVWQVPEDTNILEAEVVPIIIVRIVGDLVLVDSLASSPNTSQLNKLARLSDLLRSASAILKLSRDPPTVHNDGCAIN